MEALNEIAKTYPNGNVLVVSHGGVVRNVITSLLNVPPSSVKPENTGYAVLSYCDGKWSIKEMQNITKRPPREETQTQF